MNLVEYSEELKLSFGHIITINELIDSHRSQREMIQAYSVKWKDMQASMQERFDKKHFSMIDKEDLKCMTMLEIMEELK